MTVPFFKYAVHIKNYEKAHMWHSYMQGLVRAVHVHEETDVLN